jgi:hypothetical protein
MYVDGRVPASRDMTKGVLSTSDSPLHVPSGDAGASNKRAIPLQVQVWGKLQGKAVGLKLGVRATPKALRRGDALPLHGVFAPWVNRTPLR